MPHALLVDDNVSTLNGLSELVRAEAFTVSVAPTVEGARVELSRRRPDVVLLDVNLPDGDGMALLDAIGGIAAPAVILITGHAGVDTAIEAQRRGVTDYLTKPVDIKRLREILGDIGKTARRSFSRAD